MVLKGGHEAPTKPKGRPKKNSIPTTEEIEAEERRLKMEEEEQMRRAPDEPQDLSLETHSPSRAIEGSDAEQQPLLMSETHLAS